MQAFVVQVTLYISKETRKISSSNSKDNVEKRCSLLTSPKRSPLDIGGKDTFEKGEDVMKCMALAASFKYPRSGHISKVFRNCSSSPRIGHSGSASVRLIATAFCFPGGEACPGVFVVA